MPRKRLFTLLGASVVAILLLLVIVGNVAVAHTNPDVTHTVNWNTPRTEELARRACFDCHSNETNWPWYSFVAPMSFLVAKDVDEGRSNMNFSTGRELEGDEMVEQIQNGEMPMDIYIPLHPEANLSATEKQELITGLRATFGA